MRIEVLARIYVSTACLAGSVPLEERLKAYAGMGLSHVELGAGVVGPWDTLFDVGARYGLTFLLHNYFPPPPDPFVLNMASRDEGIRNRSIDLATEAIELAAMIGSPIYSVHGGFASDPVSFGKTSFVFPQPSEPDALAAAFQRYVQSMGRLIAVAEQRGIQILVENNGCPPELRGALLFQTADDFCQLFDALQSPLAGALLDTGHLNLTARTYSFDPLHFVDRVAPYVRQIHLHDNDGLADRHDLARVDGWMVDLLRRPDFARLPIVVESKFASAEALREHVDSLLDLLEEG